jgi:hypothetical protein
MFLPCAAVKKLTLEYINIKSNNRPRTWVASAPFSTLMPASS